MNDADRLARDPAMRWISAAMFRLTLPLPDLAELRHLVGIVPELRPDDLSAPSP